MMAIMWIRNILECTVMFEAKFYAFAPDIVSEGIVFWGCPSTAFVHSDRYRYHDISGTD